VDDLTDLFQRAAAHAAAYRASLDETPVGVPPDLAALRSALAGDGLTDAPRSPGDVLDELVAAATPGLVASAGSRYFGFVVGSSLPAATAADMMTSSWDQNAFNGVLSPAAVVAEEVAGSWLKELLGIPATASVGFVTGAQEANTVALAAARQHVLAGVGWDVARDGLHGAPRVRVVVGGERHATVDRALRLLGLGTSSVEPVAVDDNGAIDVSDLARVLASGPAGPAIVCLQAGNVNTGACDDLRAACDLAHRHNAWVHVDGAFGLWAAATPALRHLVDGVELADSWGCDGHKWLNVPYDCGFVFCSRPEVHGAAVSYTAAYLVGTTGVAAGTSDFTLESSRRARGFAVWAALRQLGRDGVAELVERNCRLARRFAESLTSGGAEVANDVVLNQVLVGFGADDRTDRVIDRVQREGTCWLGGTTWGGRRLMRVSVSSWSTTEADVDRSVAAILRAAAD
jgi:glutamate/tyrosine decarboxylase-like PLP-dependent enzyme